MVPNHSSKRVKDLSDICEGLDDMEMDQPLTEPVTFNNSHVNDKSTVPSKIKLPSVSMVPPAPVPVLNQRMYSDEQSQLTPTVQQASVVCSTPSKQPSVASSINQTLPIDRSHLMAEFNSRRQGSREKDIINLIVVGHVDAGKSTLMGNLLYSLGHVSSKQLAKYKWEAQKLGKASFAYAWVLDQTDEERQRGVTIDIAQTSFDTPTKRIALMDAPGHKDFVPSVIGGASSADAALLVVDAGPNEFERGMADAGQTREHARLVRFLGVSQLIVAVNKLDCANWKKERFDEIQCHLSAFLSKTLGLTLGVNLRFCPVSGLTGINVCQRASTPADLLASWYEGPSLLEMIDALPSPDRVVDSPFRFVVSDLFKPVGSSSTLVAGRVLTGGLSVSGSKLLCQPANLPASVKAIRSLCASSSVADATSTTDVGDLSNSTATNLLDASVKYAFAGDQIALMLQGVDVTQSLTVGDCLSDRDSPIPLASRLQAKLLVFGLTGTGSGGSGQQPITRGYPVIFHCHNTSISASISKLHSMTFKEKKIEKTVKKPRCLVGNCTADVDIKLDRPICLDLHSRCKPLGRFLIRVGTQSIAGGHVTAILSSKSSRTVAGSAASTTTTSLCS